MPELPAFTTCLNIHIKRKVRLNAHFDLLHFYHDAKKWKKKIKQIKIKTQKQMGQIKKKKEADWL